MLALRFSQFVLRSRMNAILFALIFAALPFLAWISGVIVALVTLRKGRMEGFLIFLWSLLPSLGTAAYSKEWIPFAMAAIFTSLLLWLLAILLRYRSSWVWVLYAATLYGVAGVTIIHLLIPDVSAWWVNELTTYLQKTHQSIQLPANQAHVEHLLHQLLAQMITGVMVLLSGLLALVELFFARGLEYLLTSPGGLAREFRKVRLHALASLILLACIVAARIGPSVFMDILPVVFLPFIIAGISLVHAIIMSTKARGWLMFFYFFLIFSVVFLQPLLLIFIVLAVFDSLINFRRWLKKSAV